MNTLQGDARTTADKHRQTDVGKLIHQLRGDLDWIVMKCLEKDRTRRYETANGLAFDLKRHLTNEPVLARPASAAFKLQKAFRRNKFVFSAAAAIALALVAGLTAGQFIPLTSISLTSCWAANSLLHRESPENWCQENEVPGHETKNIP